MELSGEVIINTPAQAAWLVLGTCWGHIGRWAAPITASSLDGEPCAGAVRTCHIARFGPVPPGLIKERLLDFDSEAMSFAYESIEGMPRFIEGAVNRWSVHALGDGRCVVRSHATVKLRGPMVLLGFLLERSSGARRTAPPRRAREPAPQEGRSDRKGASCLWRSLARHGRVLTRPSMCSPSP